MTRTLDTAELICDEHDIKIVTKPDLNELKHLSEVIGKLQHDSDVRDILEQIRDNADEPHWHYLDDENFGEFRERMLKALQDIIQRDETNIAVVTHSHSTTMMTALILNGKYVEPSTFYRYEMVLAPHNTGITYARFLEAV